MAAWLECVMFERTESCCYIPYLLLPLLQLLRPCRPKIVDSTMTTATTTTTPRTRQQLAASSSSTERPTAVAVLLLDEFGATSTWTRVARRTQTQSVTWSVRKRALWPGQGSQKQQRATSAPASAWSAHCYAKHKGAAW